MMKKRKFLLYIFLGIVISRVGLFGQELSNSVFKSLKQNHLSPQTQNLVISGQNNFPYNIFLEIKGKNESQQNLVLIFFQEDYQNCKSQILDAIEFIKNANFDFNVQILFSYGDNQKIEKQGMIYGDQAFINSINTNEDFTVIIFDLDSPENEVITNSRGKTAPSWLIKNEFESILNSNIQAKLPFLFLSQIYQLDYFYDRILSDFFSQAIPAIRVNLQNNQNSNNNITEIILDSLEAYSKVENREWDNHFLMFRYFDHYFTLTENSTIKIIIIIVLLWLFYIFMLIFVNVAQKRFAWQRVKKIIYTVPVTFIIILLAFILGKVIFNNLNPAKTDIGKIYSLVSIQLSLSFLLINIFYSLVLKFNPYFEPTSVDYLITFACFINQSLFILVDISLFPIFMLICLLSILALITKNNGIHIGIFITMLLPFIPYAHCIISLGNFMGLRQYLLTNDFVLLAFSFILYPTYIVYLRVLTSFRKYLKQKKSLFIIQGLSVLLLILLVTTTSLIRVNGFNKEVQNNQILIKKSSENLIDFSYSDKKIFDDVIRTINIDLKEEPLQCDVRIFCKNGNPLLYTDNDFEISSQNTAFFKIPSNPPSNMTFSYGANQAESTITITAIFPETSSDESSHQGEPSQGKPSQYKLVTKSIRLGE